MGSSLERIGEFLQRMHSSRLGELGMGNLRVAPVRRTPEVTAGRVGALLGRTLERNTRAEDDETSTLARTATEVAAGIAFGPAAMAASESVRALQLAGGAIGALTELEQTLTGALNAMIPVKPPGLPALTAGAISIGLPHAHMHPPNLVPPNPVPLALPSVGPVIPIPYLSGASTVLICGQPAARCGDMGLALWCGGYFPMFEIMLGSSSVWIEGMRAACVLTDVTRHCMFSSRGPTDPPLGPMMGVIPMGLPTVSIGGFPLPSLTSMAIAGALRLVFSVGGRAYMRFTAQARVERLLARGSVHIAGDAAYVAIIKQDLIAIASTRSGRQVLRRIERSGRKVTIEAMAHKVYDILPNWVRIRRIGEHNASATPANHLDGSFDTRGTRGPGTDVTVAHSPERWSNHGGPDEVHQVQDAQGNWSDLSATPAPAQTASDEVLLHELHHAANSMNGEGRMHLRDIPPSNGQWVPYEPQGPEWGKRWTNGEEWSAVWAENGYRRERRGAFARQRTEYGALP